VKTKTTLLIAIVAIAAFAAVAVAQNAFRGSTGSYTRVSSSGDVTIESSGGRQGAVRARYVLPSKWRRLSSLNARTIRFDTRNSCRHKVTFTPRLIQAPDVPAAERAVTLTPATSRYVEATGTREGAAFRVVRRAGTSDVVGVLVQPLPKRSADAGDQRVYAEISARATYDRRTECHSGGPRTVAEAIGDAFGAGDVGGFALRRPR
jgi:hypothetical protein